MAGEYRYQKRPGWRPDDPRIGEETRSPRRTAAAAAGGAATRAAMNTRLAIYCAARDQGNTPKAAAGKAGIVTPKTVRKYEGLWAAAKQQQGSGND